MSSTETASNYDTLSKDCVVVKCELDSHADTCCFGKGSYVMYRNENTYAEVVCFDKAMGKIKNIPIVTVALAYDCPKTFTTFILIFHQSLYIDTLKSHLICPNQIRYNGHTVNDCPLQYLSPTARTLDSH
jgi:hypothetical protein